MADRISKYLFFDQAVKNFGIAFGLHLPNFILVILFVIISLMLAAWLVKLWHTSQYYQASLIWLIILGAASNIIDRIRFGYVIDYINLHFWPVFNLADILIVVGVIMLLLNCIKTAKKQRS